MLEYKLTTPGFEIILSENEFALLCDLAQWLRSEVKFGQAVIDKSERSMELWARDKLRYSRDNLSLPKVDIPDPSNK